ncbi:MAG: hypothetical protein B7Y54_10010 [Polaromonas sp. 35-63-240]|nr:MAG: hypothetical protein B7Y54_10010 [Polaromonas sp. 35-63-240]
MWSGGIARSGEVARRLEALQPGSMVSIERLIAANAVFAFDWRGSLWLPMFQFGPGAMVVNPHARRVLTELASVFDGWAIACWFLDANLWLEGRRPIDMLVPFGPDEVSISVRAEPVEAFLRWTTRRQAQGERRESA